MAFRWQKPDYRIGTNNYSTYDPIKHNPEMPDTSNRYYKTKDASHDVTRKVTIDPLPLDDNIDAFDSEQQQQTYRDDPRYGSAHRRSQNQTPDVDISLRLHDLEDGNRYNAFDNSPHAKKGYLDHSTIGQVKGSWTERDKPWSQRGHNSYGGISDPRTGNNSYHSMGSHRAALKHGGALLFIRFPTGSGPGRTDNIGVASQAFLRSKTLDMGGKFLGIAKSVYDFGYPSGPKDALGLYHFPSPEKAKLFFQYDYILRQPDFPPPYGHAEIWTISNAYLPDNLNEYNTFLLSEIMLHHGTDKREFFEVFQEPFEGYLSHNGVMPFVKPFERYLSQNGVMPFVVCSYGSYDRECLRRHAYPSQSIITCHLFRGQDHLRWLSDQDMYMKFRSLHNQMADERCSVFTIERDLCP